MINRHHKLAEAVDRQQLRADMASRRVRDAVFELRLEAEHLAPDGALRAEVEHQRLRGLVAQVALRDR